MQKGLSVINHLLIYLIKQGPAACRHLSLVERGGEAVSGLFCPSASLGCSWWSPHKDEGMEGRWEGRGKNREEEEKGHNH